jgi:pimeloyl-ACP methyl ester carboxylesterase
MPRPARLSPPPDPVVPRLHRRKLLAAAATVWALVLAPIVQAQSCPASLGGWPLSPTAGGDPTNRAFCEDKSGATGIKECKFICLYVAPGGLGLESIMAIVNWAVESDRGYHLEYTCTPRPSGLISGNDYVISPSRQAYAGVYGPQQLHESALEIVRQNLAAIEGSALPCPGPAPPPPPAEPTGPEPVIFIPGIMGSQLRGEDGRTIWPPLGPGASRGWHLLNGRDDVRNDLIRLSLNPDTRHESIEATDALRFDGEAPIYGRLIEYLTSTGGYAEYDVRGDPARRSLGGCGDSTQLPRPNLFVFAYDWRLPIVYNASILEDYVACIATFHRGKKLNIVTHSMGGLVARRYILDHPGKVNKLITIAAPFLGAPKVAYQMWYGYLSVDLNGLVLAQLPGALDATYAPVREMEAFYPGLHNLLASRAFYELGGPLPRVLSPDVPGNPHPFSLTPVALTYLQFMEDDGVMDRLFTERSLNGKTAAGSNRDFHDYVNGNGDGQDDWGDDHTGVRYFHLIGVQRALNTAQGLRIGPDLSAQLPVTVRIDPEGPGDGTVPLLSAARIGNGRNLNAPDARLYIYAGPGTLDRMKELLEAPGVTVYTEENDKLLDHADIVNNRRVQAKVLELLLDRSPGERKPRLAAGRPSNGDRFRVAFEGRTYLTQYAYEVDNGVPIDEYYYPILQATGVQATQDGQPLWGRFVRVPAAGQGNQSSVVWWHVTWVPVNGGYQLSNTPNVTLEVLGRAP